MADDDKEPRWDKETPPGFMPDGTSLIAEPGKVKMPETRIKVGDKTYSPEEYDAMNALASPDDPEDEDLSDLDELDDEFAD